MTDYKKKKQLIEENKDVYISDYDKDLSYDALSRIVDAKKSYAAAAKNNNEAEMKKYNNIANAIRAKYGNYTGGEFGDEYHPFVYTDTGYGDYKSRYEDELEELYSSLKNLKFDYDYSKDPAYQAYKKVYDNQGELAYDRALAQSSLKTGGIANSHAYSAATQAMNHYNSMLAAKIPELYEAAYQKHYNDKKDLIRDAYEIIENLESRDYSRHKDKLENYRDIRDFNYQKINDRENRDFSYYENEAKREFEAALAKAQSEDKAKDRELEASLARAQSEDKAKDRELETSLAKAQSEDKALDRELEKEKINYDISKDIYDRNYKNNSQIIDLLKFYYSVMRDGIDDEKWIANHNLSAAKSHLPGYANDVENADILDYARKLFGNPNLTDNDLYNLFSLR